jgi:hypothetical protein
MALLRFGCALIAAAATWASYGAQAEVTRIEIASRADILGGKPFGASGVYEKIVGKVFFSVDPAHPRNKAIVDLDKAPRDADGRVTFSAGALRRYDPISAARSCQARGTRSPCAMAFSARRAPFRATSGSSAA